MDNYNKEYNLHQIHIKKGPFKIFSISSLFGLFFGIVSIIIIYIKGDLQNKVIIFILPVFCGLLAGFAGVTGNFFKNWLKSRGIQSRLKRSIISFIIVLIMTLVITFIFYFQGNFFTLYNQLKDNMVWGIFIGCVFGIIITIAEYYNWKVEKKMLILEMKNKHLEEIAEKDSILKETAKSLLIARERNKMARELHDSISQGIHGITFGVDSLRQELDKLDLEKEKVMKIVNHLEQTAENTQQELRHVINELQPALLEKNSLKEALSIYCDLFAERQTIQMDKVLEEIDSLSPEQELSLFRIVQEALANIQKHANADKIEISFKKSGEAVFLTITDNGRGFDTNYVKRGNGLNNMEFRSRQAGGKFNIKSSPEKGTEIRVII